MWFLTSEYDSRVIYLGPGCESITFGRNADISVSDDQSLSRKHACITLSGEDLVIQDLGSKYYTFLNKSETPLNPENKVTLNVSDVIKFGRFKCIWVVNKINFITCSSTLKGETYDHLMQYLNALGGEWKKEWDDTCSYLTMPAITLTIKIILALIKGAHLVTTDYWEKCCKAIQNKTTLPDPKLFLPNVLESTLNSETVSFLPNNKRRDMFKDKTFVFFTRKQYDLYKQVIVNASGKVSLITESRYTKSMLCSDNIVVVQPKAGTLTEENNTLNDIMNYLKSRGKRAIPDVEISLAVVFVSTEKHCNPDFFVSSEVMKNTDEGQAMKPMSILAKDTQDMDTNNSKANIVINESLNASSSDVTMERSTKRKLADDNALENVPVKRMATSPVADDEDLFNFVIEKPNEQTERKLMFTKPQKRKVECISEDEDLFNFLGESQTGNNSNVASKNDSDSNEGAVPIIKKPRLQDNEVKPIRGSKAQELMDPNITWKSSIDIKVEIKDEAVEGVDLGQRMRGLDLGTTVIEIMDDLIKKESVPFVVESETNGKVKNFKKFKKVWPLKFQRASSTNLSEVYTMA